ncbi:unnamed protein product [Prorocentrum cordatum]|uniref:Secreted protein n=1 Tax=Prorocentrum cordatum TaxID=2364126 RepID=A0ABN9WY59_9DINO|nr:unnamed protein product [Polarella glacialis]
MNWIPGILLGLKSAKVAAKTASKTARMTPRRSKTTQEASKKHLAHGGSPSSPEASCLDELAGTRGTSIVQIPSCCAVAQARRRGSPQAAG